MAIIVVPGQVAVGDPSPSGPNAISNVKNHITKIVKLSSANFATGSVDTNVAVLPADATITSMSLYVKTQLAGNSISAAVISIGTASAGTQFISANAAAYGVAGTSGVLSPITNIFQNYNIPLGGDIYIWVRGTSTGGTPNAGELYLTINYVR